MAAPTCSLCPRQCNARRAQGQKGVCAELDSVRVARAALHHWEEPPISGSSGSGAVFFSGCPLHCVYCQNASISRGGAGREVSVERLARIFLELQDKGALNINLVTPTHYALQICRAVRMAREEGLQIPIVYNTSGYEKAKTIHALAGFVDIFLTDFKYASAALAQTYSHAPDYPQVASAALDAMHEVAGAYRLGDDPRPLGCRTCSESEVLLGGVVVRHMLLPGFLEDSKVVMQILAEKPYADAMWFSFMNQYTPMDGIEKTAPELNARVCDEEYEQLVDFALELGLDNSFMQVGGTAEESFIPQFDGTGV